MSVAVTFAAATKRLSKGSRSNVAPREMLPTRPVIGSVVPPPCLIPPPFCTATNGLAVPGAGKFAAAALLV